MLWILPVLVLSVAGCGATDGGNGKVSATALVLLTTEGLNDVQRSSHARRSIVLERR